MCQLIIFSSKHTHTHTHHEHNRLEKYTVCRLFYSLDFCCYQHRSHRHRTTRNSKRKFFWRMQRNALCLLNEFESSQAYTGKQMRKIDNERANRSIAKTSLIAKMKNSIRLVVWPWPSLKSSSSSSSSCVQCLFTIYMRSRTYDEHRNTENWLS